MNFHSLNRSRSRTLRFFVWLYLGLWLTVLPMGTPVILAHTESSDIRSFQTAASQIVDSASVLQLARQAHQAGLYQEALQQWKIAEQLARTSGDLLIHVSALNGIALSAIQLGQYSVANSSLSDAMAQLGRLNHTEHQQRLFAQALSIRSELHTAQGQYRQALQALREAEPYYQAAGNLNDKIRHRLNQSELLRLIGLPQQAMMQLAPLNKWLNHQPDSLLTASALRQMGKLLYQLAQESDSGLCQDARDCMKKSLEIAEQSQNPTEKALTLISWGNIAESDAKAQEQYRSVTQLNAPASVSAQAQVNLIQLLINTSDTQQSPSRHLTRELQIFDQLLDSLPVGSQRLRLQASLLDHLLAFLAENPKQASGILVSKIEEQMDRFWNEAQSFKAPQFESYALGYWGRLLGLRSQWTTNSASKITWHEKAKELTQAAVRLAEENSLNQLTYRWLWQQGRLLKAELVALPPEASLESRQSLLDDAIISYGSAVKQINQLRGDLLPLNRQSRLSFRQRIKPIYLEYIDLLIQADDLEKHPIEGSLRAQSLNKKSKLSSYLTEAIQTADSLQVVQLTNFFRADCLIESEIQLENLDPEAAIIYPIISDDHIDVILGLSTEQATSSSHLTKQASKGKPETSTAFWSHYRSNTNVQQFAQTVRYLRCDISLCSNRSSLSSESRNLYPFPTNRRDPEEVQSEIKKNAEQLYDVLIRPFESQLEKNRIKTLVFVPSGSLQNVPMAALYDRKSEQFLIEKYAIATSPSLQLLASPSLSRRQISAVLGALTVNNGADKALIYAEQEVKEISQQNPSSKVLLGNEFTQENIESSVRNLSFPIVHLATHGQFGSTLEETYIVTADDRLNASELSALLQRKGLGSDQPIELLVLSACETAKGDELAALGLSGIAIRSGARSTLGSLWLVDDEATSVLMQEFYRQLSEEHRTRAEALRQAQLTLLRGTDKEKRSPYFWASFVLIGSWL